VAAGRYLQTLLFSRAVNLRRYDLAVPVNQFGNIRIVEKINRHRNSFAKADNRSGSRAVVSNRAYGMVFRYIQKHRGNPQRHVGFATGTGRSV
jgi:hypothetical protein